MKVSVNGKRAKQTDHIDISPASGSSIVITKVDHDQRSEIQIDGGSSSTSLADGDYGDIIVSGTGTVLTIDSAYTSTLQPIDGDLTALSGLSGTGIVSRTALNTYNLRTLQAPAAGLTISNPAGTSGDPTFALANDLSAVEGLSSNGLATRTGTDTWTVRTLTAPAAGITVSNGDGVSGNPTLALANDLSALEGLSSNGIAVRTTTDTWTVRTLTAPAAGITVSNGDGVSGNPTLALANDLSAVEGLSGTGLAVRTGTDTWTNRTIAVSGTGLAISNGDGVSGNPTITITPTSVVNAVVVSTVITATGYTTVNLPSAANCRYVSILCCGGGASGGNGQTGDNSANRGGGGGGSSAGWVHGVWRRAVLPDTLYAYVGAGGASGGTNAGDNSLVETANTSFTGAGTPQFNTTLMINSLNRAGAGTAGSAGGAGGTASTAATESLGMWSRSADTWKAYTGNPGGAGNASGTPADLTPFPTGTTVNSLSGGAGGAGKNTVPTAAAGGKHAAQGSFSATVGGTAPGGVGQPGDYGPNNSTLDQLAYAYGGTGGASHTAGTGGAGGKGAPGCGGGGGGAGTVAGGNSGAGGDGFVVILCFG